MKLTRLLPLMLFLYAGNCFAENTNHSTTSFYSIKKIYLKVAKPVYIDVSKNYTFYGILGPEAYMHYISLDVLDNNGDTTIADKIVVTMNDYQARSLNAIQGLELYIHLVLGWTQNELNGKTYQFIETVSREEFIQHRIYGIFFDHSDSKSRFELKVKSKHVSASISAIASLTVNDSIEKDTLITYEVVEPIDSMAVAFFGKKVYILKSEHVLKSNSSHCYITMRQTALQIDNGLSKEILYEVISVVPVEE